MGGIGIVGVVLMEKMRRMSLEVRNREIPVWWRR
jgi:hypothetical protein